MKEPVEIPIPKPRTLVLAALITLAVLSCSTLVCIVMRQAFIDFGFMGGLGVSCFLLTVLGAFGALVVSDTWKEK